MSDLNIYQGDTFDTRGFEVYQDLKISTDTMIKLIKQQTRLITVNKTVRKLIRNIEINKKNKTINYEKKLNCHYFLEEFTMNENNEILKDIQRMNRTMELCSVMFYSDNSDVTFEEIRLIVSLHKYFTKPTQSN